MNSTLLSIGQWQLEITVTKYLAVILLFSFQGQLRSEVIETRELLEQLGFSMMRGEMIAVVDPSPLSPHELELRATELMSRLMENHDVTKMSPSRFERRKRASESMVEAFSKSLREGGKSAIRFQIFIGPEAVLASLDRTVEEKDDEGSALSSRLYREWIWQDLNERVVHSERPGTVTVRSQGLDSSGSMLDNVFRGMGALGRVQLLNTLNDKAQERLKKKGSLVIVYNDGSKEILKKGERLEDKNLTATITAKFREGSDLLEILSRVYRERGDEDQREEIKYENFQKIGNVIVPLAINSSLKTKAHSTHSVVKIYSWELMSDDRLKAVQLPKFGYVNVADLRVTPQMSYPAYEKVLSKKQLLDFVADPTLLKEYLKEVRERRSAETYLFSKPVDELEFR